mmetsp:Transcript_15379/g.39650  ORF Transcript_15379/g.39650 Transcript_15379/m.39650 type:complete len:245 (+) Transcript_15379:438-1172(+)
MKTRELRRSSPGSQGVVSCRSYVSYTACTIHLWSSPLRLITPFIRNTSRQVESAGLPSLVAPPSAAAPPPPVSGIRSCSHRMSPSHLSKISRSTDPGTEKVAVRTVVSIWLCVRWGSFRDLMVSSLMLNAPMLRTNPRSISARTVLTRGASPLMARTVASTAATSSGGTKSVLLMMIRSAVAICRTASFTVPSGLTSRTWRRQFLASIIVTIPSRVICDPSSSSNQNIPAIGMGSASPVVSNRM